MITMKKLEVYQKFGGDVDGLQLMGTPEEKRLMADGSWSEIYELMGEVFMLKRGLVSREYAERIRQSLETKAADSETRAKIMELA